MKILKQDEKRGKRLERKKLIRNVNEGHKTKDEGAEKDIYNRNGKKRAEKEIEISRLEEGSKEASILTIHMITTTKSDDKQSIKHQT